MIELVAGARFLRVAVIRNQLDQGNITRDDARERGK